jgi:hypothetical protein
VNGSHLAKIEPYRQIDSPWVDFVVRLTLAIAWEYQAQVVVELTVTDVQVGMFVERFHVLRVRWSLWLSFPERGDG